MDMIPAKESSFCRHPKCHYMMPGLSMAQRGVLRLGLKAFNLILKTVGNPERLVDTFVNFNRRLCGFKIRHQKVGGTVWPFLEGGSAAHWGHTDHNGHKGHVVLLHGFGADKDRFGGMGPFLRRYFHVVIPDLPGFGDHLPDWSASYGIEDQVRRFNRFVNAAGLGKFHLFGISLGGYIAAYYAARYPQQVRSLCLMDSVGFSSPVSSDAWSLLHRRNRNIFLPSSGQEMQDMVDFLMCRPVQLPTTIKAYWLQQAIQQLAWRKKMLVDLFDNGIALMDKLAQHIIAPTLVIWGAEDRICHVSTVDHILGIIDNSHAYVIQGCGHIPILEFPSLSQKIYMDFLQQVGEY